MKNDKPSNTNVNPQQNVIDGTQNQQNKKQQQAFDKAFDQMEVDAAHQKSGQYRQNIGTWEKMRSFNNIAWTGVSLNLNCIVSTPLYLSFLSLEGVFIVYLLISVIYSQVYKISISDMWVVESYLTGQMSPIQLIVIHSILLVSQLILYVLFIVITINQSKNLNNVEKQSGLKRGYLMALIFFDTVISTPLLVIMIREFFTPIDQDNFTLEIIAIALDILNIGSLTFMSLIFKRIYYLRIQNQNTPWSSPNNRDIQLKYLIKVLIVFFQSVVADFPNQLKSYIPLLIVILIAIQIVSTYHRMVGSPTFNIGVETIQKVTENTYLALMVVILINSFSETNINSAIFYIFLLVPVFTGMSYLVTFFWRLKIVEKLRKGEIKTINEYLYAFHILQEQIRIIGNQRSKVYESMSFMLSLIKFHNLSCFNNSCFCHHSDSLIWILRRADQERNENYINLFQDELEFLNNYNLDEFIVIQTQKFDTPFSSNYYLVQDYVKVQNQNENIPSQYLDVEGNTLTANPLEKAGMSFGISDMHHIKSISSDHNQIIQNNAAPQEQDLQQNPIMKIDLQKLIQSFLLEYIRLNYLEAASKFPKDPMIQLSYANFALEYMHNIFLTINLLRSFDYHNYSWIEKLSYQVNEAYLVHIQRQCIKDRQSFESGFQFKQYGVVQVDESIGGPPRTGKNAGSVQEGIPDLLGQDSLDADHFIQVNYLSELFFSCIQLLAIEVIDYWKGIVENSSRMDVQKIQKQSHLVAERISKVQNLFQKINNITKYADHKTYHSLALVHRYILNDHQQYELYMNKMKSLITMQKLFKNNNMKIYSDTDIGIILVNSFKQDFGKIIMTNQILMKQIGYNYADLKHQRISFVMPKLVRENHDQFVTQFQNTGSSLILHTNTNFFLLHKNNYVAPYQVHLQFNFSVVYGHTVLAYISSINEMQLQKNGQNIKTTDIMFFLCDKSGFIYEVSESCCSIIGLQNKYLSTNELRSEQERLNISDLIPDVQINYIKEQTLQTNETQKGSLPQSNVFEMICEFDLEIVNQLKYSEIRAIQRANKVKALVIIFHENYKKGLLELNIIAVKIIEDAHPQLVTMKDTQIDENFMNFQEVQEINSQVLENNRPHSISSSDSNSHVDQEMIKQSIAGLEKQSPRSLKIILQLIIIVFLVMITISSINLSLTQQRSEKLSLEISSLRQSYMRINYNSRIRIIIRVLVDVANGYENDQLTYFKGNRSTKFSDRLKKLIEELRQVQTSLENADFDYSEGFNQIRQSESLPIQYLTEDNKITTSNHTMSFTMNLYVSRLLDVYNLKQSEMVSNATYINLTPNKSSSYKPTSTERNLFFVIQNGKDVVRQYLEIYKNFYVSDIKLHADESQQSTQTTIIISICSILIVGVIVTPLLTRIVDRQYQALQFFLLISEEQINQLILKCYFCIHEINNLVLNLSRSQSGSIVGINHQNNNTYSQDEITNSFCDYTKQNDKTISDLDNLVNSSYSNEKHEEFKFDQLFMSKSQKDKERKFSNSKAQMNSFKSKNKLDEVTDKNGKFKSIHKNKTENFAINSSYREKLPQNSSQNMTSQLDVSEIELQEMGMNEQNKQKIDSQEEKVKAESQQEQVQNIQEKQQIIKKHQFQRRIKIMGLSIIVVILLSSYFVASYFMSLRTFTTIPIVADALDSIYSKSSCVNLFIQQQSQQVTSLISIQKESIVRNQSLKLFENSNVDAFNYILDVCQQTVSEYKQVRRNTPDALSSLKDFINDIESSSACSVSYKDNSQMLQTCNNAYNGIIRQGLQNTFDHFLSILQEQDIRFRARKGDLQDLKNFLAETKVQDIIEATEFVYMDLIDLIKEKATDAVISYYSSLLRDYLIFFSCFICILFILIMIFSISTYKKIKQHMMRTNMTLRILPLEALPQDKIQDLKKFFK